MDISVVIPCYKSAAWLPELVSRLCQTLRTERRTFEVILVCDAPPDNTWSVIEGIARQEPAVVGVNLAFNVGQFRATMCGLAQTRGETVLTMDDDFQHPPEEVVKLLRAAQEYPDFDAITGKYEVRGHNVTRRLGTMLQTAVERHLYGKPKGVELTSFRLMKGHIARAVAAHGTIYPMIGPLLLRCTKRVKSVPVVHTERTGGVSGYSFTRLVSLWVAGIIGTSTVPLKFVSFFGFGVVLFCMLLGLYFLAAHTLGYINVPGFVTQVLLISFFGGMMIFCLGMLGFYVVRAIEEVSGTPRFIVRQIVNRTGG